MGIRVKKVNLFFAFVLVRADNLIHSAAPKFRRGKNAPLSISILSKPRSLDRGVEGLIFFSRESAF